MGSNIFVSLLLFALAVACFTHVGRAKNVPMNEEEHARDKRDLKVKLKMTLEDDCNNCCPNGTSCCDSNGNSTGACECSCDCGDHCGGGKPWFPYPPKWPKGPDCSVVRNRSDTFFGLPVGPENRPLLYDFFCPGATVNFLGRTYTGVDDIVGFFAFLDNELNVTDVVIVPPGDEDNAVRIFYCSPGQEYVTEIVTVRFMNGTVPLPGDPRRLVIVWRLNGQQYCIQYISTVSPICSETPPSPIPSSSTSTTTTTTTTTNAKQGQCQQQGGTYNPRANSCFVFVAGGYSQAAAHQQCIQRAPAGMRGRLAFIETEEDYALVSANVRSNAWIGAQLKNPPHKTLGDWRGSDFPHRGQWAWYEWNYRQAEFGVSPPRIFIDNRQGANCMHYWPSGNGLSDDFCTRTWPALCEFISTSPQERTCYSIGGGWCEETQSCMVLDAGRRMTQGAAYSWCRNGAPGGFSGRLLIIQNQTIWNKIHRYRNVNSWIGGRIRNAGQKTNGDCNPCSLARWPHRNQWGWYDGNRFVSAFTWVPPRVYIDNGPTAYCMHYWREGNGISDDFCHRLWPPFCEFVYQG